MAEWWCELLGCALLIIVVSVLSLRIHLRRTVYCTLTDRLDGKTVLITGASSGIGREVALECAARGARVVLGCRNVNKAEAVTAIIKRRTGNDDIHYVIVDLSSLKSVRHVTDVCDQQHWTIDVLINNAAYMGPKMISEDGYDFCFQVNFVSHFYLTNLIVQQHRKHQPAIIQGQTEGQGGQVQGHLRVINVASDSYSGGRLQLATMTSSRADQSADDIYQSYANSKLAMMLFTTELNFRHTVDNVVCLAVHPGAVKTGLQSNWPGVVGKLIRLMAWLLFRDARQGAQSIIYSALLSDKPSLDKLCGKLVVDCRPVAVLPVARSYRDAERLWAHASQLCQLDTPVNSQPSH